MKLAKGYFGSKSKQYRAASEQVRRSLRYAYIGRKPDYIAKDIGNDWLVFPHEIEGLSLAEVRVKDPALAAIMERFA